MCVQDLVLVVLVVIRVVHVCVYGEYFCFCVQVVCVCV